jgi:hypothetical protein
MTQGSKGPAQVLRTETNAHLVREDVEIYLGLPSLSRIGVVVDKGHC